MKSAHVTHANQAGFLQSTLFLVLGAETVLFGTLVMSYLFLRSGGSDMEFSRASSLDLLIAGLNTLILFASAASAARALAAMTKDRLGRFKINLMLALILGAIFVVGQIFEFHHSGMHIADSAFGGVFFALISFHALHVLAGMLVLGINFARAQLGDFNAHNHVAVTGGTWFWYYVTVVWFILFIVLYLV